jgi:hypothetical protein
MSALIGDTLYFDAEDGSTGKELWAFAINGVNVMTNTGGVVTSYEINPSLPSGLSFGTSNGTIWGTPTVLQTTAVTYTIYANNSGGSVNATVNITINDEAPGPFEYNPENNTLTNNTYVHLAPQFINQTTGNGSTWQVADIRSGGAGSGPGSQMSMLVGDTMYFDANEHNYVCILQN